MVVGVVMKKTDDPNLFDILLKHRGHEIECVVQYANVGGDFVCFVDDEVVCAMIVCSTCGEVLWREDNPNPGSVPTSG